MTVRDDGVGICAGDLEKDQAFGLLGIRERLGAIGGEVRIAMGHSRGTTITVLGPALTLNPASAWHGAESLAT